MTISYQMVILTSDSLRAERWMETGAAFIIYGIYAHALKENSVMGYS